MIGTLAAALAGGFVLAGVVVGIRAIVGRRRGDRERRLRDLERRRLAGLGVVKSHREDWPLDGY